MIFVENGRGVYENPQKIKENDEKTMILVEKVQASTRIFENSRI